MSCAHTLSILLSILFIIGYAAITLEHVIKMDKAATALLVAVASWTLYILSGCIPQKEVLSELKNNLCDVSQIIFFLLGALILVEIINAHDGFSYITKMLHITSKRKLLWVIGFITFFLSAMLDNLTTTIVMVSLLSRLMPRNESRLIIGAAIVIAANAGGAWTPIGDVTTTMLWIGGQISSAAIMGSLFLPSFACLLGALAVLTSSVSGQTAHVKNQEEETSKVRYSTLMLFLGLGALIFVPIFKVLTGLPPYMGIFLGVGVVWLITDILHRDDSDYEHLRMPAIFRRVDLVSIFFFIGILLAVGALESAGILKTFANWLDANVGSYQLIATVLGLVSAVIDNVPLVAASMGMYPLEQHPMDTGLWDLIAYCAGTGGSILIIGSAAGVVYMGMEKVDFFWYLKKASLAALVGYFGGITVYLAQQYLGFV